MKIFEPKPFTVLLVDNWDGKLFRKLLANCAELSFGGDFNAYNAIDILSSILLAE